MGVLDITSYPTPSKLGWWGSTLVENWYVFAWQSCQL